MTIVAKQNIKGGCTTIHINKITKYIYIYLLFALSLFVRMTELCLSVLFLASEKPHEYSEGKIRNSSNCVCDIFLLKV